MIQEMIAAGYQCGNNIHSLPGEVMHPTCAGQPWWNDFSIVVHAMPDRIRVCRQQLFGRSYSRESYWDTVTIAVYASVDQFRAACPDKSLPGLPAYAQGWD